MDMVLEVDGLTKDYGGGRGVFDVNLTVGRGEVFGYVGTNGSGKTTTIRNLMGFIKPDQGRTRVAGLNPWENAAKIMTHVSYIPGEIAFPSLSTGTAFLKLQAEYLGVRDFTYMNRLIEILQLDPTANLRRMSKGMKQKTAIVAALMGEREILIMDEPTTGLDPLMRDRFIGLIREEKKKGRTIFMSSHLFEEIEEVCDKVAMIEDGRIVDVASLYELRHGRTRNYRITFKSEADLKHFTGRLRKGLVSADTRSCEITIQAHQIGQLLRILRTFDLENLEEHKITLEEHFMKTYEEKKA